MEYLIFFSLICSGAHKDACLKTYQECVETVADQPSMEGTTKDEIALLLSQNKKFRAKLCK